MSPLLTTEKRLAALTKWAASIQAQSEAFIGISQKAKQENAWFSPENIEKAVRAIGTMLQAESLATWAKQWSQYPQVSKPKKVGLILAGNIPMVGFHDVVCVLAAGHTALIKLSSQDKVLIPYVLDQLISIEPAFAERINYVERLVDFDAVIATGSNNSSRYFEYYFGKVPHIIRKNRTSVAFINGNESEEELQQLGVDIFSYFGLGCRNVSKIYVPKGYNMAHFFEPIESYNSIIQHHKYLNNYEYNKSIYLVNSDAHLDNGFLLTKPDNSLYSPLAVLFTEEYSSKADLEKHLQTIEEEIQCVASMSSINVGNQVVPFGYTQFPRLWDYADGRDVMQFLCEELPNFSGN
ncbi:MAG: acyl-CoA reductase [Sphingobacteriales bacterium]|jgi:hypothetical protein|nr:acyl-CoA reductase [Sphingobacteriales bacterium]